MTKPIKHFPFFGRLSAELHWYFEMPDGSAVQKRIPTFNTLAREEAFKNPPQNGSTHQILNEFVTPHIESFNSLFDDSGLPSGDGDGRGLLALGLKDIGERVAFDGRGADGESWGNRMRSMSSSPNLFRLKKADWLSSMDRAGHNSKAHGL